MKRTKLCPHVAGVLTAADRAMLAAGYEDTFAVYEIARIAASKIIRVDSFCIGLFCGASALTFPYHFGQCHLEEDNFACIGRICEWVRDHSRPYRRSDDTGKAVQECSASWEGTSVQDCVSVPLFGIASGDTRHIVGTISILACEARAYTVDEVQVLEWIAESVATARRCHVRHQQLGTSTNRHMLNAIAEQLGDIRRAVEALTLHMPGANLMAQQTLNTALAQCERGRAAILEALVEYVQRDGAGMPLLTPREQEVLELMVQGCLNKQIAAKLNMAPNTVKTHVSSIMRKFGVAGRSGVVEIVK